MQTNAPIDPVSDAISRATYLVEEARVAVLRMDIPKAKACLLEAAAILSSAKNNKIELDIMTQQSYNMDNQRGECPEMKGCLIMKLSIYKNYGVLGAEKRCVYTYGNPHATATCWDEIQVQTPEGWDVFENYMGEVIVEAPWGYRYSVNEVLAGDARPEFYALDDHMTAHHAVLDIVAP